MERITLPPRADWRDKAAAVGFGFHTLYGEPYWIDDAAYRFTMDEIEGAIEPAAEALHALCLELVDSVVEDEVALTRLHIPVERHELIRESWRAGDRHLYGRFDLAWTGAGSNGGSPKLLEYNADTPTSIFEAAFFQHNWLIDQVEAGALPNGADQFNWLQESLVEAFGTWEADRIFHFACATANEEDAGTTSYLMDCAAQAGHRVEMIDVADIGVDDQGRFTDTDDRTIDRCFKLYPWEDMLREPFAKHLRAGVFVEPPWKMVLSNKAVLPMLWDRHPGHPNLLPAFVAGGAGADGLTDFVTKPVFSREGENITLTLGGRQAESAGGDYGDEPRIVQAYAPLFRDGDRHAVLGAWMIGDRAAGLGVREDASLITRNTSRFVPHVVVD